MVDLKTETNRLTRPWLPIVLAGFWTVCHSAAEPPAVTVPDRYVLTYPMARQCCPPIRSTFIEVGQTFGVVKGRRFTQKVDGGYGLPVIDKQDGKNLLHTGADLGWYQVGEPVFAIADGVVRESSGLQPSDAKTSSRVPHGPLQWGNLVVLEHRFGDNEFYTSIYGHLGVNRRVRVGDIVVAGQMIGEIGRKHPDINGGYDPHVHFAMLKGRKAEIGAPVFNVRLNGVPHDVSIQELGEEFVTVSVPAELKLPLRYSLNSEKFEIREQEGKAVMPARVLWLIQRDDFPIVGYALSMAGWEHPIEFLRKHSADTNPAPLRAVK